MDIKEGPTGFQKCTQGPNDGIRAGLQQIFCSRVVSIPVLELCTHPTISEVLTEAFPTSRYLGNTRGCAPYKEEMKPTERKALNTIA